MVRELQPGVTTQQNEINSKQFACAKPKTKIPTILRWQTEAERRKKERKKKWHIRLHLNMRIKWNRHNCARDSELIRYNAVDAQLSSF